MKVGKEEKKKRKKRSALVSHYEKTAPGAQLVLLFFSFEADGIWRSYCELGSAGRSMDWETESPALGNQGVMKDSWGYPHRQ